MSDEEAVTRDAKALARAAAAPGGGTDAPTPGTAKRIVFLILLLAASFCGIEGVSSVILVVSDLVSPSQVVAERIHTRYDPEIGWINIPGLFIRDMYGPGISLRTSAQAFRNDVEFPREVAAGRVRAICSGDSFTFGYGVANADTWCQRLTTLDGRLEVVNMAQGGYGIDQAYLWYLRDGARLDHQVHLFAFITLDFARAAQSSFLGYGKPMLAVENGRLVTKNVPVPVSPGPIGSAGGGGGVGGLRSLQLMAAMVRRVRPRSGATVMSAGLTGLALKVFEALHEANARGGSALVLVYLPVRDDYDRDSSGPWRAWLSAEARKRGLTLVDLVEPFRQLPRGGVDALFIPRGAIDYAYAAGHYSVKGNEYIARQLYDRLLALGILRSGPGN